MHSKVMPRCPRYLGWGEVCVLMALAGAIWLSRPQPLDLARRLTEDGQPDEARSILEPAIRTYRALVEDQPADVASWLHLARLEGIAGRAAASRDALAKAAALRPDATDLTERLAYRHTWLMQPERAAAELTRARLPF